MAETEWELFCGCGERHFTIWKDGDFGNCFMRLVFSCIPHGFLAISSAYQLGKHWPKRFCGRIIYSMTLHFRHAFCIILVLGAIALLLAGFLYAEFCPGLINVVDCGFRAVAWFAHSRFVWGSHRFRHVHLRGPVATVVSFLLVHASSFVLLQSAIRHQICEARLLPTLEEWFVYGSCFVYVLYALTLLPHRRPQPSILLHLQDDSQEILISDGDADSLDVSTIRTNPLSIITFSWVNPLMKRGAKGQIRSVDDVFELPSSLNTVFVSESFHNVLCESRADIDGHNVPGIANDNLAVGDQLLMSDYKHHKTLLKGLMWTFGREYFFAGLLKLFGDSMTFVGPILLNLLLNFMVDRSLPLWHGYVYTAALLLSTLLGAIFSTHFNYHVTVVGLKFRAALVSTVYDKTLTVSSAVFGGDSDQDVSLDNFSGTGEVVNLMSTDVDRVVNFCPSFHQLWSLPLQVAVALYLLYLQVGVAFLAGVGFAVLLIPVNRYIAVKIADLSQSLMAQKDARVKVINEALYGIRAIKLSAWETLFSQRITVLRSAEVRSLAARKYLDALCVFFWAATPVLISLLTFLTYVLLGNRLTAAKVFTSIALFGILIVPLNAFPWVVNGMMEAWVSINRLQRYMNLDSICWIRYYTTSQLTEAQHSEVCIVDGTFAWQIKSSDSVAAEASAVDHSSDEDTLLAHEAVMANDVRPTLIDINFTVPKGAFVGIIGPVGAGKTALLCAIAAEMQRTGGEVVIGKHLLTGGFGLTLQDAWVQHATLRDNVLFGRLFDSQKYDAVIAACALQPDIKILPAGDKTEIGENGVTLSGGQKARVALARAVYQEKDVYLLDDPLAAVDVHVARHLYTECIVGLLRQTTRVLVTHHVHFLLAADFIIVVEGGRIRQIGLPADILSAVRSEFLDVNADNTSENNADSDDLESADESLDVDADAESSNDDGVLVADEERRSGVVRLSVYWSYWTAVGRCLASLVLLSILLMQG